MYISNPENFLRSVQMLNVNVQIGRPWQQPVDVIGLYYPGERKSLQVKEDIWRCVAWARVPLARQDSYYVHASTWREVLKQFDNGNYFIT